MHRGIGSRGNQTSIRRDSAAHDMSTRPRKLQRIDGLACSEFDGVLGLGMGMAAWGTGTWKCLSSCTDTAAMLRLPRGNMMLANFVWGGP